MRVNIIFVYRHYEILFLGNGVHQVRASKFIGIDLINKDSSLISPVFAASFYQTLLLLLDPFPLKKLTSQSVLPLKY